MRGAWRYHHLESSSFAFNREIYHACALNFIALLCHEAAMARVLRPEMAALAYETKVYGGILRGGGARAETNNGIKHHHISPHVKM